jgi:hypothetical protein
MEWMNQVHGEPLSWLLEEDLEFPAVRYCAMRDLLDYEPDDPRLVAARDAAMHSGTIPAILDAQEPEGYWVKPGAGYSPKYQGTVWQIIFLAQMGADGDNPIVRKGCDYVLNNNRSSWGSFSYNASLAGMIHCLEGNLCSALVDLGFLGDERLDEALEWMARSVTGEGIAPAEERNAPMHYYLSGNCAPGFACSANNRLPCAWGAVKVMLALGKVPQSLRTGNIKSAIEVGREFLLSRDPAVADYPMGYKDTPSRSWFQFGFPLGYVADVLQTLEALVGLGCGEDVRLTPALDMLLSKQDEQGRWKMEYSYNGKMWSDIENKGKPSKWVTLRALRVLKAASQPA